MMAITRDPGTAQGAEAATESREDPGIGHEEAGGALRGGRLFSAVETRAGFVWVAATVPFAAVLGLFVHGQRQYMLAWVLIGALNLVPAVILSVIAWRRAIESDKRFWKLISIGVALMGTVGLLALAGTLTGWWQLVFVAMPLAVLCVPVFYTALFALVRARAVIKVNALDVLESVMLVIAVCAFAPLIWGNRPVVLDAFWFTGVAIIVALTVLSGFCWSLALFRRVKGQHLPDESVGLAIGFLCGLNGVAQAAQGLTGFELSSPPLLVMQALCFGVLLVMPLQLTENTPSTYDTLAPTEQVRTRSFDTIAISLLVPMLAITIARHEENGWIVWYFVAVGSVLGILALVRGKLAIGEMRRLYSEVERAADARRQLLVDVLQSADHDRHRVATQLHQQATGFYVAWTSFLRRSDDADANPALRAVRDDLETKADELRELMLAVRPIETAESGTADLKATLSAYIDGLYLDAAAPQVDIRFDEGLALDWTTETIVMRILQEALRNVANHAHAQHIIVSISEDDEGVALKVQDDGVGFDAKHLLFESGNEYMRNFASHLNGHVFIESEPGKGTTVKAVLKSPGRPAAAAGDTPDGRRNHLRLITTPTSTPSGPEPPLRSGRFAAADDGQDPDTTSATTGEDEDKNDSGSTWQPAPASMRGVSARMAQRRAVSDGRRFLYFRSTADESVVRELLEVGLAALVLVPIAFVSALAISPRPDSRTWMFISFGLSSAVVLITAYFVWVFRRRQWNRFDPRLLFALLFMGMLSAGAYGVATGGEPALFGFGLVTIVLVATIAGSPMMVALLWATAVAMLCSVLVITDAPTPMAWWIAGIFASTSALIACMVHLTVWKARDGLRSLEGVAEFASYTSNVRSWEADKEEMVGKVADAVAATAVVVFERPHGQRRQLREVARYASGPELSPFLESDLRLLAERAHPDGEFEMARASDGQTHLLTIAASTMRADIVLAVQLDRVGPRDDTALIAAVSMLASAVDRSTLIDGLLGEALTDPLTGLANRRQLQEYLKHTIGRAARAHEPVSLAMLDLDKFKHFNDTWGHAAGDRVLMTFAERLSTRLRSQDIAARYGGEEFCLLLPGTTEADTKSLLDDMQVNLGLFEGQPITFSGGVAEMRPGETADELVARADAALYEAKAAGRQQTHVAQHAASARSTTPPAS